MDENNTRIPEGTMAYTHVESSEAGTRDSLLRTTHLLIDRRSNANVAAREARVMSTAACQQVAVPEKTLELTTPKCEKGIGSVILAPDSQDLIAGVRIHPYPVWPDDRGYFLEIARIGRGLPGEFPQATTQVSAAVSYPGTIKAFHFHRHQTDCWVPLAGMLQIALVDLRTESQTFGIRNTLYVGEWRRWQVLVPPGIAHGYKVIGTNPAVLVYLTDRFYNPQDEGRIPYDDPLIRYEWTTQHK